MSAQLAADLCSCGARRIIYVSCNVTTQARDLQRLCSAAAPPPTRRLKRSSGRGKQRPEGRERSTVRIGRASYRLVSVQAVDMFPHTSHVETVAVLDACD